MLLQVALIFGAGVVAALRQRDHCGVVDEVLQRPREVAGRLSGLGTAISGQQGAEGYPWTFKDRGI